MSKKSEKHDEISPARMAQIAAIPDDAIDYSDIPDMGDDDEFWDNAILGWPPPKKVHVTIRLDEDIIEYFKTHPNTARGYQTRINALLRAYVHAKLSTESAATEETTAP